MKTTHPSPRPSTRVARYVLPVLCAAGVSVPVAGCTTASTRAFATSTYFEQKPDVRTRYIAHVRGTSCETKLLGIIPMSDESPTTTQAVSAALAQQPNTLFIANLAIDESMTNSVIWTTRCIVAEGDAMANLSPRESTRGGGEGAAVERAPQEKGRAGQGRGGVPASRVVVPEDTRNEPASPSATITEEQVNACRRQTGMDAKDCMTALRLRQAP